MIHTVRTTTLDAMQERSYSDKGVSGDESIKGKICSQGTYSQVGVVTSAHIEVGNEKLAKSEKTNGAGLYAFLIIF